MSKPIAIFPGGVVTDARLKIATNRLTTTLSGALTAGATTMTVTSATGIVVNSLLSIYAVDSRGNITGAVEIISVDAAPVGNVLPTITRGYDGTTAAAHASGASVAGFVDAWHHNALVAEVEAIETALGAQLGTGVVTTSFDFAAQGPGAGGAPQSLVIGANSITLTPVPLGVNATDANHYLYLSNGTGTAEAVKIIGGTAVAGAQLGGTVIVTCVNTHSGAWTIRSATAGIQEALVAIGGAGKVVIPAGTFTLHAPIQKPPAQVWIQGAGMQATVLSVAADFALSFLGVCIIDDTGLAARTGPSGGFSDLSVSFIQPDSTNLGDYTHWPPAFYVYNDQAPFIMRAAVQRAWDVIKYLDGGGLTIYDIKASFFHHGIDADNILDTLRVEDFHATVYGLTTNQYGIFWNNAAIYTFYLGYITDGCFSKVTSIAGRFLNSHQGTRGSGLGLDGFIAFIDCDADTNGGFEVDGGMVRLSNSFISTGGVTASVLTAQPAITQTGGLLQVVNTKFSSNGNATGPMVSINFKRDVNTGGLYAPSFTMGGCIIEQTTVDQSAVVATESNAYTNTGSVTLFGNTFIKSGSGNMANPIITIADGTGSIEATITGNHFTDKLAGTGDGIVLSADRYHSVTGNTGRGWTFSVAGRTFTQWLGNPGFASSTNNLIDPLAVAAKISGTTIALAKTENWIASETGANNAIAGALVDALGVAVPLSAGLKVAILLGHTLQAGANTMALNGGAAKNIKSSRNAANNIGTAYAATGIITMVYDGTSWLDVSQ